MAYAEEFAKCETIPAKIRCMDAVVSVGGHTIHFEWMKVISTNPYEQYYGQILPVDSILGVNGSKSHIARNFETWCKTLLNISDTVTFWTIVTCWDDPSVGCKVAMKVLAFDKGQPMSQSFYASWAWDDFTGSSSSVVTSVCELNS